MDKTTFSGLVEFSESFEPRPHISHVVFDFDGTLSLIREGWPDVMVPLFLELLPPSTSSTRAQDQEMLLNDIAELTGKQTIYQMIRLAERIKERGGTPEDPLVYKHEYLKRLDERIKFRHLGIEKGGTAPDKFHVFNTIELLEDLKSRGLKLFLASGTDEPFVKHEASLLGLTPYFGEHIYGALDDYKSFSKKMVIDRILRENNISGDQLLSFGDGYVEIENTKQVGGLAVAVASDESNNGSGLFDQWKKERLAQVHADVFIPDYRDIKKVMQIILGELNLSNVNYKE